MKQNRIIHKVGDIVWAEPNKTPVGCEEKKRRPYLIINRYRYGDLYEVAPLVRGETIRNGPDSSFFYETTASGRDSLILLNQRHCIDGSRIGSAIARLPYEDFDCICTKLQKLYDIRKITDFGGKEIWE